MFKFEIEIGDWSKDGHEKSVSYTLESNKDIDYIRKAFLNSARWALKEGKEIFDPQKWCYEYRDNTITVGHYDDLIKQFPALEENEGAFPFDDETFTLDTEFMLVWTVEFIKMLDPSITIEVSEPLPQLHFYGQNAGEHIESIGYGLLD